MEVFLCYFYHFFDFRRCSLSEICIFHGSSNAGAVSSVGRASRLHREGQRFETVTAHHLKTSSWRNQKPRNTHHTIEDMAPHGEFQSLIIFVRFIVIKVCYFKVRLFDNFSHA